MHSTSFLKAVPWLLTLLNTIQPIAATPITEEEKNTPQRYVFAHFMLGIVSNRVSVDDYNLDMTLASDAGIDAFAINVATDTYTDTQLDLAYEAAAKNNMKVFLSFDFNYWKAATQAEEIGAKVKKYANHTAQLHVDDKVFVSTFLGEGLNVTALRESAGVPIYFAPNWQPGTPNAFDEVDAAMNRAAWPNNGANRAPTSAVNLTVEMGDEAFVKALGKKDYIAPASPWYFTHYGAEVSYSKNWVFPSDNLWSSRWQNLLESKPRFVNIISWNDYGESSYVGPLSPIHTDDGASKWANNMPHGPWLDLAKPYIQAFHAGKTEPTRYAKEDSIVYWYRPHPASLDCDATDTTMINTTSDAYAHGRPDGWQTMTDSIFITAIFKTSGNLVVNSGDKEYKFRVSRGVSTWTVPMSVGAQTFALYRKSEPVIVDSSARNVTMTCPCGNYNFNAYVGRIPALPGKDSLPEAGKAMLLTGIRVPEDQCRAD